MATRWADGVAMVKACDQACVHLFVVSRTASTAPCSWSSGSCRRGARKLAMVAVNVFWQRPQSYYNQDSWRGSWEFDGGALIEPGQSLCGPAGLAGRAG